MQLDPESPVPSSPPPPRSIHCISFSQDEDLFVLGTDVGFSMFNVDPVSLRLERSTFTYFTLITPDSRL